MFDIKDIITSFAKKIDIVDMNNIPMKKTIEMLKISDKGLTVPSLTFDSTGTKKMVCLASYVIDALENGRILVVDELDNSLHFKLVRAIIAMFNNELNTKAQLICTVHDINLLIARSCSEKNRYGLLIRTWRMRICIHYLNSQLKRTE